MAATQIDQGKLDAFMGQFVGDLGAALSARPWCIGDKLGLYKAMADGEPVTPAQLAERTGTERALRARVAVQPGGERLRQLRRGQRALHAPARAGDGARPGGQPGVRPRRLPARDRADQGRAEDRRRVSQRRGRRLARARPRPVRGTERFFRPGYAANLVTAGSPRSMASRTKLRAGRARGRRRLRPRRLDDPHGGGLPAIRVRRLRLPRRLDRAAHATAAAHARASPTASASRSPPPRSTPATGYDLVAMFDCLHDMGDPVGAAAHVLRDARRRTAPG